MATVNQLITLELSGAMWILTKHLPVRIYPTLLSGFQASLGLMKLVLLLLVQTMVLLLLEVLILELPQDQVDPLDHQTARDQDVLVDQPLMVLTLEQDLMGEIVVVLTMVTVEFHLDLQTVEGQIVDQDLTALDLDLD